MSLDLNNVLTSLLGGQTAQTPVPQQANAYPNLSALLGGGDISNLLAGLTGQAKSTDPLAALFGGSLGAQDPLAALFGSAQTNPYAALLGGTTAPQSDLQSLLALLTGTQASVVDNSKASLKTYDVNVLRKIGDSTVLGGNGDGRIDQKELGTASSIITILTKLGKTNPVLDSLAKTVKTLSRPEVFTAIASKDGNAASIGATDIVVSALSDTDRQLDTINLTGLTPAPTAADPLSELLALLTGKAPTAPVAPVAPPNPWADLLNLFGAQA